MDLYCFKNRNRSFDLSFKSLKKFYFSVISLKNLSRSLSQRMQLNMTWHSFSTTLAWHREQILKCSGVLRTVYLPVSLRSWWLARRNLLRALICGEDFLLHLEIPCAAKSQNLIRKQTLQHDKASRLRTKIMLMIN